MVLESGGWCLAHEERCHVNIDIALLGLCDGGIEGRELVIVDLVVGVLDGNLNRDVQVDAGVHGSNGKGQVDDISAGADAGVKGWEEELAGAGGQVEWDIESGVSANVELAGLLGALSFLGLGRLSLVPESAVIARIPS